MCGIAGQFGSGRPPEAPTLNAMADALAHRGPDDAGVWIDAQAGIGFAHRRLAILDLSSAGHQPMLSHSGRLVIAFNGEIYNHLELRAQLGEQPWRGHSDTETLLVAIEHWGVPATLARLTGMFAIAVWDRSNRHLILARDRLGEKPLYYGWQGKDFLFASELHAIRRHPSFLGQIDRNALSQLLRFSMIPAPWSIYQGIQKLLPGHWLEIDFSRAMSSARQAQPRPYWSIIDIALAGQRNPFQGSEVEAIEALDKQLLRTVRQQMLSDVPVGAFLSGGIDSSLTVAAMQAQSAVRVKTFTIGFDDPRYNEAGYAKAVAQHLGTDHTEAFVTGADALAVIPKMAGIYDEPFADSSQIPTYLVATLARQHVTVSLSGDGGDELFGGYARYDVALDRQRRVNRVPRQLRAPMANALRSLSQAQWDQLQQWVRAFKLLGASNDSLGSKAHAFAALLEQNSPAQLYKWFISHERSPSQRIRSSVEPAIALDHALQASGELDFAHRMMLADMAAYLPDDILVKVDRAAMAVSLETRVPLLDHNLVELAWRLPLSMKRRAGVNKWLPRQLLRRYVPDHLIDRSKMGFAVPLESWLRGPLRPWAEELLSEQRLRSDGFFEPTSVRADWQLHLSGANDRSPYLWDILMFQAWLSQTKPAVQPLATALVA